MRSPFMERDEIESADSARPVGGWWECTVTYTRRFDGRGESPADHSTPNEELRRWAAKPRNQPPAQWREETDNPFRPAGD